VRVEGTDAGLARVAAGAVPRREAECKPCANNIVGREMNITGVCDYTTRLMRAARLLRDASAFRMVVERIQRWCAAQAIKQASW